MALFRTGGTETKVLAFGSCSSHLDLVVTNDTGTAYARDITTQSNVTVSGYTLSISGGQSSILSPVKCVVHTGDADINIPANTATVIGSSTLGFYITNK